MLAKIRRATRGARDFLGADEKRGIPIQEFHPVFALGRLRFLVGQDGDGARRAALLDDVA